MVEVFSTVNGELTSYDDLDDARAKIATQQKIGVDQIRMERINEGPNNGKYIYKVLIKTNVAIPGGRLTLYSEENTVQSLLDAYITANENVKIFYNGNIVTDLNQQIRADGSYQVIVTLPNIPMTDESKTQLTANGKPNKL
jgi:hypothetical protein